MLGRVDRRRADPPAVLRGHRRRPGRLRLGLRPPAAPPAGRRGERRVGRAHRPTPSRPSCTRSASSSSGRCCGRSSHARGRRRCCSSTRSTAPTTSSRPTCSRCCPTGRSRSPSSACSAPTTPPLVVLTSNRTRDVHDALKRRCLYHWVEHPDFDREVAIVRLRVPEVGEPLARQVAAAVAALRELVAVQAAGRRRDDRLGRRARPPRRHRARRAVRRGHARHGAQVPRGPRAGRAARLRRHRQAGARARRRPRLTPATAGRRRDAGAERDGRRLRPGAARRRARRADEHACSPSPRRSAPSASTDRDDVYWAGRATLVRRPGGPRRCSTGRSRCSGTTPRRRASRSSEPEPVTITLAVDERRRRRRRPDAGARRATTRRSSCASAPTEVLRHKDFAAYDDAELAEAHRLMDRLRFVGSPRRSLRLRRRPRRTARPDLRRTVRAALRTEGEPIRRHFRAPATRHRRLVLLLDVSGSMEPYARALLRFVQAAVAGRRRVEAFALGTRLTRITRELGSPRPRPGAAPGRRAGRRLVGRHPARRRPAPVQRRVGRPRHGPRRGRRDPLRRLGPRRPGGAGRADAAAAARRPPHRLGQPAQGHARATPRWPGEWRPRCRTLTASWKVTRSAAMERAGRRSWTSHEAGAQDDA